MTCQDAVEERHIDPELLRPLRFQAEIVAIRADLARDLAVQLGRIERLMRDAPLESLSVSELLALDELLAKMRLLTSL